MDRRDILLTGAAAALPMPAAAETRAIGDGWRYVADGVMGGVSQGTLVREVVGGREAARLTGSVSTENDGGFIQASLALADGSAFDATAWSGVALDVLGNDEIYELRLRTTELTRPWQSYRAAFRAPPRWSALRVPFDAFEPNRTDRPLDLARLVRLGVLAVGRPFEADIAFAAPRLWR